MTVVARLVTVACLLGVVPAARARSTSASLMAPARAPGDRFGAALDGEGSTLAVGAPGTDGVGAVYVFTKGSGVWSLQATLAAADAAPGDELGAAVALDGDTLVVGAPGRGGATGAAYVFTRAADAWTQRAVLTLDGAAPGWRAGSAVDVADDLLIVGAPGAFADTGAAVAFVGTGAQWTPIGAAVDAGALHAGDRAGHAVATDGATVVVGAPRRDGAGGQADLGSAFVGTRTGNGIAAVTTLGHRFPNANDRFGSAVDVRGDALAVGVPSGRRPTPGGVATAPGAVEMFERTAAAWVSTARLSAFGPGNSRGESVRIGGTRVVSGAPFSSGTANVLGEATALYVAFRSGVIWQDSGERLTADVDDDLAITTGLGTSVALADDAIAGGAPAIDDSSGRVYLFESRPPVIDMRPSATPSAAILLEPVRFSAGATDPDDDEVSLFWTFGDGAGSTANPTMHRYRVAGAFDVGVIATDGIGETDATVRVDVAQPTSAVTQLTFVERLRERLEPAGGGVEQDGQVVAARGGGGGGGGEREIATTALVRLQGMLAMAPTDVATLGPSSRFRFALGRLLVDVALGDDTGYVPGAPRAKIVLAERPDQGEGFDGLRYLTLQLDWGGGNLTFKMKVIPAQRFRRFIGSVLGEDLVGAASGRRTGALPGAVTFGPATATFVQSYGGKVVTVDRTARRSGRRTYRSVVKVKANGGL